MTSQQGRFYIRLFKARWWPVATFLSAVVAALVFSNHSIELTDGSKAIAGIASFHLVDIGKRVSSFYYLIGSFAATFVLLSWLFTRPIFKLKHFASWLKRSQIISLFGIVNLFVSLVGSNHRSIVELLVGMLMCLAIIEVLAWKLKYELCDSTLIRSFCYSLILAIILKFGAVFILLVEGRFEFFWLIWILFVPMSFLIRLIPKTADKPLALMPFLIIISSEIAWIFRERIELNLFSTLSSVVVVFLIIWLLTNQIRKLKPKNSHFYALILLSISLLSFYSPSIANNRELFEFANPANAVLRAFQFGEIPVVDYLNSHLLSELTFRFLYVLLNGYSGNSAILIYDFLEQGIFILSAFLFLKRVMGKGSIAFFICLFFPWLSIIIPPVFSIALLSVLMIEWVFKKPNVKTFLVLAAWCIFLILWRIDLGASNLIATVAVVFAWIFIQRNWIQLKTFLLAAVIVLCTLTILFVILELSLASELSSNFKQALGYFGAGQAHGFEKLSKELNTNFFLHHFIFPLSTVLIGILSLLSIKVQKPSFHQIAILFLSLYILFNLQRGLVRHGFMENTDLHLSSFYFLLLPLFLSQLVSKKIRPKMIILVAVVLVTFAKKTPLKGYRSTLLLAEYHSYRTPKLAWKEGQRITGFNEFETDQFLDFKNFMDENFDESATFIDMSNSPVWYYYLKRAVPSYFNQYLQNTVTHPLQKVNIDKLEKLNVPVAIFSRWPDSWWDRTDRVPNALRYFETSQFLFDNYHPYGVINNRYIWIKKGLKAHIPVHLPLDSTINYKEFNLLDFPQVCEPQYEPTKVNCQLAKSANRLQIPTAFQHKTFQFVKLQIRSTATSHCEIEMLKDEESVGVFSFNLKKGSHSYFIPICTMYNWIKLKPNELELKGKVQFEIQSANILDKK